MRHVNLEEWEALSFFEVEPLPNSKRDPWPYGEFVYEVERKGVQLSFAIEPSLGNVKVSISHCGEPLFDLDAKYVMNVEYRCSTAGTESLVIELDENAQMIIVLKPQILIRESIRNES